MGIFVREHVCFLFFLETQFFPYYGVFYFSIFTVLRENMDEKGEDE